MDSKCSFGHRYYEVGCPSCEAKLKIAAEQFADTLEKANPEENQKEGGGI